MPTKLKVAKEKSTYMIIVSFFDENENPKDVDTMKWTLTDTAGNIINSREDVVVADPTSEETIVLSGDDLAILDDTDDGKRLFTIEATYDSTLGNDLPLNGEAAFTVVDLMAIKTEI